METDRLYFFSSKSTADFPGGSDGKVSVYMRETSVRSLGQEDSLEKEMSTHSSTLAWKIPWTAEVGAGHCPWCRKESGTTERLHFHLRALQMVTAAMKLKDGCSLEEKL